MAARAAAGNVGVLVSAALRFLVVIARDVRTLRLQTMCAIALGMD
jgi:hypothetical protein